MSLSKKRVNDYGNPASKLWIIGEAPGEEEERLGEPFVGPSGKLLFQVLNSYGVHREDIFISNLCPYRPFGNDFKNCEGTKELFDNISRLHALHTTHKPNLTVGLGRNPLYLLCAKDGISNWRGSILDYNGRKFIPTYHPAAVLREYSIFPIFAFDLSKIVNDSKFPDFNYPDLKYIIDPHDDKEINTLFGKEYLSCDIETTRKDKDLLCIGFGYDNVGVVFPFTRYHDSNIRGLLSSTKIVKIFHHGAFDVNVLRMKGYEINNIEEDTIIQAHVLEPELPRSLAYLTSIYTRLPYYKSEGRAGIPEDDKTWSGKRTKEELYVYNAKDAIVTYQIWQAQKEEIKTLDLETLYRYEMEAFKVSLDLSQNGLLVDKERQELLRVSIKEKVLACYTQLAQLTGRIVNPRSTKDVPILLYDELKLPIKKNKAGNRTSDEDAIVELLGFAKNKLASYSSDSLRLEWMTKILILKLILDIRGLEKLTSSYINFTYSSDGRVRSLFKVHATETGRWSASKFVDDTGLNLQTLPRESIEI